MSFNLSIVSCIKSYSSRELLEWFLWHKFIGVDHFYIFDNDGEVKVENALEKYKNDITLINKLNFEKKITPIGLKKSASSNDVQITSRLGYKPSMYADIYNEYKNKSDWMAFIDDDEFIFPLRNKSIKKYLSEVEKEKSLVLQWRNFSPSGKAKTPTGGVIFDHYKSHNQGTTIKTIINCKKVNSIFKKNHFLTDSGVDANYNRVELNSSQLNYVVDSPYFVLNHYCVKSFEDAISKLHRRYEDDAFNPNSLEVATQRLLKQIIGFSNEGAYNCRFNFSKNLKRAYYDYKSQI